MSYAEELGNVTSSGRSASIKPMATSSLLRLNYPTMARRDEARALLEARRSPVEIADAMGISVASVIQYLRTCVGEGSLRFSDIYFSIPEDRRQILQHVAALRRDASERKVLMSGHRIRQEELDLFISLRKRTTFAGDLYEYITDIEVILHDVVRYVLMQKFGGREDQWWRKGVPSEIRKRCVTRREDDEDFLDAFCYTDLLDIFKNIDANRQLFGGLLPKNYSSNRKVFSDDFSRLNRIRNTIMHPVKPRKWSQQDFAFVREMARAIQGIAGRAQTPIPSLQPIETQFDSHASAESFGQTTGAPRDQSNVH